MAWALTCVTWQIMDLGNRSPLKEEIFPYTENMRKTKVLIVDDEPAIREVLEMILQEWGYDVRLASDGAEAKDLVESYDPEIVISDVVMPQLFIPDLLRCLKAGNPNRPVILVTAHASIDLAVPAMKQGAQDFITKPMAPPKRGGTM